MTDAPTTDSTKVAVAKRDGTCRRATFGVPYPTAVQKFEHKSEVERLNGLRATRRRVPLEYTKVEIPVRACSFDSVAFKECNFHVTHGAKASEWRELTFRDCSFESCFLGYIHMTRVTFIGCRFERSDLSRSELTECVLRDCEFVACTSYDIAFGRTIIDPVVFDKGNVFPSANYNTSPNGNKQADNERWKDARVSAIRQILVSNTEAMHAEHADAAMVLLRKASGGAPYVFAAIVMSMRNLLWVAGVSSLILAVILVATGATYQGRALDVASVGGVMGVFAAALGAFMGFGFTNVGVPSGAELPVALIAGVGVLWYAAVTAFLLRRWAR